MSITKIVKCPECGNGFHAQRDSLIQNVWYPVAHVAPNGRECEGGHIGYTERTDGTLVFQFWGHSEEYPSWGAARESLSNSLHS